MIRAALGLPSLLAWSLAWSPALPIQAQTAEEDSVLRRPRPDYQAVGIGWPDLVDGVERLVSPEARRAPRGDAASDVTLYPTLQSDVIADGNALRRQSAAQGDFATKIAAGLTATGEDTDRGWSLAASADSTRWLRFASQNGDQARLRESGFVEPGEDLRAALSADEQWLVEPIEDSSSGYRQQRPNRYALYSTLLTVERTNDDWQFLATERAAFYRFAANPPVIAGKEQDRDELTSTLHVARSVFEGTALFVEPQVNLRHYVREVGADGLRHDSSGGQILGGVRYDLSSVTFLEAGAGWLRQVYVDPAFAAVSGPALQARSVWNPLDRLSLEAGATRRVAESNLAGTAGAEVTSPTVSAAYEIEDNLMADLNFSFTDMHYKTSVGTSPRVDGIKQYGANLRYLIDETVSITASWTDYRRSSTVAAAVLDFQRLTVSMALQW